MPIRLSLSLSTLSTLLLCALFLGADSSNIRAAPVLSFSSYLGGSVQDEVSGTAVDLKGFIYLAGTTRSPDFPVVNAVQSRKHAQEDVFVVKMDPVNSTLVYSTYLGGNRDDEAYGVAVDESGCAYITGRTRSPNFPVKNAYQSSLRGDQNAFITKLDPSGKIVYSTYLGVYGEAGTSIAVYKEKAYVVGFVATSGFPLVRPWQRRYGAGFLAILDDSGSRLLYSSYVGGRSIGGQVEISVDGKGAIYFAAPSLNDFYGVRPIRPHSAQYNYDVIVVKFNAAASSVVYATYLGGSLDEQVHGVTVDEVGNVYFAGHTASRDFPTVNAFQGQTHDSPNGWDGGINDAFLAKLSPHGQLAFSTYLGGSSADYAFSVSTYKKSVYVGGWTNSSDFPILNSIQSYNRGQSYTSEDAFITRFDTSGRSLIYSTYLGGSYGDSVRGLCVMKTGAAIVAGTTESYNFPLRHPIQREKKSGRSEDLFISILHIPK